MALCAAAWLLAPLPALAAGPMLLSLVELPVRDGEYLSAFKLDTWTVRVLAVCRLPIGWTIAAGTFGDPGGVLSGSGNIGAGFLDRRRIGALRSLALVQVEVDRPVAITPHEGELLPATFAGTATVGRYGQDVDERTVALSRRNVRLRPAARCPDPLP